MTGRKAAAEAEPAPESDRLGDLPHPRHQTHLFGHDAAMRMLALAGRSGRMPHAWLIGGPKGVGKATLAWRFAMALLDQGAENLTDDLRIAETSIAARLVRALSHPDLLLIRRPWDEKTKKFKSELPVDEVRRLGEFLSQFASRGGWRVAIVDCGDDMNRAAENALLKTLEEPPAKTVLIVIAHAPGQLLPTTRSRCRHLMLRALNAGDMEAAMSALAPAMAEDERQRLIAVSAGAPGQALALAQAGAGRVLDETLRLVKTLPNLDLTGAYALADTLAKPGGDVLLDAFLDALSLILRRLILVHSGDGTALDMFGPDRMRLLVVAGMASLERWIAVWDSLAERKAEALALNLDKRHLIVSSFLMLEAATQGARTA